MREGRLRHGKNGHWNFLRASSRREADMLAGDLKALNDSRKEMTQAGVEEAVKSGRDNSTSGRIKCL